MDNGNGAWDGCEVDVCFAFGTSGDLTVPRDYDGDGRVDAAVYRGGYWYILPSRDGGMIAQEWGGMAQDIPVPADDDGDGKAASGVSRWGMVYLRSSDGGTTAMGWGGMAQDIPVPADYDGDGKADIAVYRVEHGTFFAPRTAGRQRWDGEGCRHTGARRL